MVQTIKWVQQNPAEGSILKIMAVDESSTMRRRGDEDGVLITDWNMMVAEEGGREGVVKALKTGLDDYIFKSFAPRILEEKFEAVVGIGDL
jgi:DNA-binding response OmpR family regulator